MVVQEHVDVLSVDAEEREDVAGPVNFIGSYTDQKWLDMFQSVLGLLVEDLSDIYVLCLATRREVLLCWEEVSKFVDCLVV